MLIGNIFSGFMLKLPKDIQIAPERNINIQIKTDYEWGSGWTGTQQQKFIDVIFPKLKEAGFIIKDPKDNFGCETLHSPDPDNKMDIYMHPMEFTGYAREADIKKIYDVFTDSPEVIYNKALLYSKQVYDVSDEQYLEILKDNEPRIREHLESMKDARAYEYMLMDAGFDFAKIARIPRIGDHAGYSARDVDIAFVQDIAKQIRMELKNEKEEEIDYDT